MRDRLGTHAQFSESIVAAQQAQQKAWEDMMRDRQKQMDQAQLAAQAAEAAAAAAASKVAPASGDPIAKPAPYKPSILLIGFVKFVNMFAPEQHNDKASAAP